MVKKRLAKTKQMFYNVLYKELAKNVTQKGGVYIVMEILYCKPRNEISETQKDNYLATFIAKKSDDDLYKSTEYHELVNLLIDKYSDSDKDTISYIVDDIIMLVKSTYKANIITYIT